MTAHIMCISAISGLPIFTRRKGNTEALPFSVIGSLNGVHMFGKQQCINLLSTFTDDYTIAWKEFNEKIVLIGISSGCTYDVLQRSLESIFSAVVLIVGMDEINHQRNIERLKRELKVCYPVIDRLLDSLDCGDSSNKHSSDLVGMAEAIMCPENQLMQIGLDAYTQCVDSRFSCILIHGKIAAATDSWWSLHPDEIKLLSILATAENTAVSKDIPVFLPYKSPNVAFRFVACSLIPEVQICSLCGPTPVLSEIEHLAVQSFRTSIEILNIAVQCHPRNFPIACQLDVGILGLLLVNLPAGKYMMSKNPQQNTNKKIASSSHRLDILRTFFYQAVRKFLITENERTVLPEESEESREDSTNQNITELVTVSSMAKETYWCSEYHKCHASRLDDNILCVLYNASVPTHAMRVITQKTLKMLVSDKQVCW